MERPGLFVFLCWALPVLSCPGILGAGYTGTPVQCQKAEFVPGYNLAGEGFDIVKMQRKGAYVINMEDWKKADGSCELRRNQYLNGKMQKIPLAMVDWRTISSCKMKLSSTIYESSESLVNDSTSSVENNWKTGLDLNCNPKFRVGAAFGGTHSRDANFAMKKSKEDRYSFTSHEVSCSFYRYRLVTKPPLHKEFQVSVKMLPKKYTSSTKHQYYYMIQTYGTHFITQVSLGGKVKSITSIKSCQATLNGLTDTAVKDCLDVEASANIGMAPSMKAEFQRCESLKRSMHSAQNFSSMFSDRHSEVTGGLFQQTDLLFSGASNSKIYNQWIQTLKTLPDVVSYSLKPLHELVPIKNPARQGLQQALQDYILENALLKKCSEPCRMGTRVSVRDCCACVCNSNQDIKSNCCPARKGLAQLRVFDLKAQGLYGDLLGKTDGSVRVSYGEIIRQTGVINNNDNPIWHETLEFGSITISMATQLKFEVYDADHVWNSDLLGKCSFPLQQGTVKNVCYFKHGTFFFSYTAECAPSLGGPECNEYIPSPMSPSLATKFHSRNGVLASESWVAEFRKNHTVWHVKK
ncbi:perforin-1-like [Lepisosteus oculatus]|uniref:perforin-1-like n=1 Tax=Lepisosteus oculatus TaxID=7918 RepID=UPI00371CEC28